MSAIYFEDLEQHNEHDIQFAIYRDPETKEILNASIECIDCGEVIESHDKYPDLEDEDEIEEEVKNFHELMNHYEHIQHITRFMEYDENGNKNPHIALLCECGQCFMEFVQSET